MKNNMLVWVFIVIIFILLVLFNMAMHDASTRITQLEEEIVLVKEDLQIHKDVFASYLNGTLSQDMGGGE